VRATTYVALVLGLALAVSLILWQGVDTIVAGFATAGWAVLLTVPAYAAPLSLDTRGWGILLSREVRPRFAALVRFLWIGTAANSLLPVAQIGGELVKARLLMQRGIAAPVAGASVVVDKTSQAATQIVYGLAGAGILLWLHAGTELVPVVLGVSALFGALVFAFYRAQRAGLFRFLMGAVMRVARGPHWLALFGGAEALDRAIHDTYRRRGAFVASFLWRLAGRVAMVGEVWFALYLLGHPVGLLEAMMLDSLGQAVRGASFLIPASLGVQEGSYILLGQAVGLGPDVALSLALIRRMRDLMVGVPGLIAWQVAEGWSLVRGRALRQPR